MAEITYNIYEIEPNGLSGFKALPPEDIDLITSTEVSKTFKPNDNFIELSFFTLDDTRLETISTYDRYSILSGDRKDGLDGNSEIGIDVQEDYLAYGYGSTEGKVLYNFLDYPYSNIALPQDFYIESISTDRTELRLVSVNLDSSTVLDTTNEIKTQFDGSAYIPDFHLYFGNNIFFTIVNIDAKAFRETTAVLIKLLEPLPRTIGVKATLNIVEKVSDSIAYEINTVITPDKEVIPTLRGANFAIDLDAQATEPSQYFNYNELFSFASYNSYREVNSLFNEKGAELGIDYSDFANFINFSSAEERLRNFRYKLQLLESYQTQLDIIQGTDPDLANSTPPLAYTGTGVTGTTEYWKSLIEGIINNFDHYERHLFYENESSAWPKQNASTVTSKPYQNLLTTNVAATTWYNAELQDAILFDAQNGDLLRNTVPSYLIEDPDNRPYELIVHMVAQHFDNIWIYTNQVSEKYDADNRLDRGASKDLIEELLKNFGVKLYTSNKSVEDLFRYFTTNSYDRGGELIPSITTAAGQESVSQNDYQKEIYKRIYHNLPLLMKSKGTERGLRALITCFGIPSDVLKVRVFGGESSEEFPFFGGQQAITGSIDKVRLNNTGSITPGDTVSFYTSVIKQNNEYTPDLHRIEVGFSPAYNINEYIVSQSAELFPNIAFDIDDFIGDPRGYETNKYPPLYAYAKTILANIDAYNLKDFVRLIKFFDNVLFRMVRDFSPARAVTDAGIIIKPHLLDRSKFKSPEMTWTQPEYSGSIDTAFISGSHGSAFDNVGFGSIGGQSSTNYFREVVTPLGKKERKINEFEYSGGEERKEQVEKNFDEAKFDGEFKNSNLTVTNGELNEDNPFKNIEYPSINYDIRFLNQIPDEFCILRIPDNGNRDNNFVISDPPTIINIPQSGIFSGDTATAYTFTVDEDPVSETDGISHYFDGEQYEEFDITATHTDDTLTLPSSDEPCTLTRTAVLVKCELVNEITALPPSLITENIAYNIHEFFFAPVTEVDLDSPPDGRTNNQLSYYIDDVFIGSVQGNTYYYADGTPVDLQLTSVNSPLYYTFTNIPPDTSTISIRVEDSFDNRCNIEYTPVFDTCPIRALDPGDINPPDKDNEIITVIDPVTGIVGLNQGAVLYSSQIVGNTGFFQSPFGFENVSSTTKFYFRLIVIFTARKGSPPLYLDPLEVTYGPGHYLNNDELPEDDQNSNESSWAEVPNPMNPDLPFTAQDSILPSNYNDIIVLYSGTGDYPDVTPLITDDSLIGTFITTGDFSTGTLGNLIPEYPPSPQGVDEQAYIKYYIQFRAVNNENCDKIGPVFEIVQGETKFVGVDIIYKNATGIGVTPAPICLTAPPQFETNRRTVYVEVPETFDQSGGNPVTPSDVINQMMEIYDDDAGTIQAPAGLYAYGVGNLNGSGQLFGRHWGQWGNQGNTPAGYDEDGNLLNNWRTATWANAGGTYFNQGSGSPGKFYCQDWINLSFTIGPSDRRLKSNINLIGKSPSGINIYSFEFKEKDKFGYGTYQGVMSDEINKEAVNVGEDGYDRVDYSLIDVEFKKIS